MKLLALILVIKVALWLTLWPVVWALATRKRVDAQNTGDSREQ